jgi:hypothetical protein
MRAKDEQFDQILKQLRSVSKELAHLSAGDEELRGLRNESAEHANQCAEDALCRMRSVVVDNERAQELEQRYWRQRTRTVADGVSKSP